MTQYIYRILNTKTNKFYVGRTQDYEGRIYTHLKNLKSDKHPNIHLQRAYNADHEYFTHELLEEINHNDKLIETELAIESEQLWIDSYYDQNRLYNLSRSALTGVTSGKDHACYGIDWARLRMGNERYLEFRRELSIKFSGEGNPFYGKSHSQETIEHFSEVCGSYGSNNPFYGKSHSEETRRKISEKRKSQNLKKTGSPKPMIINNQYFKSIAQAMKYWKTRHNVGHTRFGRYMRDNVFDYEFITKEQYEEVINKCATTIESTETSGSE